MATTPIATEAASAPARWLIAADLRLLEAICDTLIPSLEAPAGDAHGLMGRSAGALQVAQRLAETLGGEDDETRRDFRRLLALLRGPLGGLLLVGRPIGFMDMDAARRERALRAMANSPIPMLRQGFQAVKRLAAFIFYAAPDAGGDNPNWPALGFAPPPAPPALARPFQPLPIDADVTLEADVVVVGSGAGGSVVAAELAARGKAVLILERGGYYDVADFTGREAEMMPRLYLKRGLQASADLSVSILAGSCLGGGTVVNWSTSLRAPESVLHEWERDFGLSGFTGTAFAGHYDAVAMRLGVNTQDSAPNANNTALERGCAQLGYHCAIVPRNAAGCAQRCGACGYGCPYGRKQSMLVTYLRDAVDHGAQVVVGCRADRVTMERGAVSGVEATAADPRTGRTYRVTVRARTVVVAAGALHSPALLLRSGLHSPHLGRNLWLHPVVAVSGLYPWPIRTWEGSPQTRYSEQFADLEDGYGVRLEVAPAHPGLLALSTPWAGGRQHKEDVRQAAHLAAIIVLARDRHGGRVTLDRHGEPVVHYTLGSLERRLLTRGAAEAVKIHLAAGATRVSTLHTRLTRFEAPSGDEPAAQARLRAFLREVERRGLAPNRVMLFSAHQMGTCRMASDPRRGVVDDACAVYGVRGLYVADGSLFPTAVGVNPMLTILAAAHRAAAAIHAT